MTSVGDFMLRVVDNQQGFEAGMRVEILPLMDDATGRMLQRAPHGPYRVIECQHVEVHGARWLDVTLRRIRRR